MHRFYLDFIDFVGKLQSVTINSIDWREREKKRSKNVRAGKTGNCI